ncbi:MAG: thioredoxin domain-containing protein [Puniceicoccaceae bacterium]
MGNLLGDELSLYLRQHASNPVHWRPWGEAAFEEAKASDRPVLVSIGYSSCHWCHVMERESFEDPDIADLMNAHFVCIKVDREERPDVDSIYMEAVQMIQGNGGWPLNVFCLPDKRPFFGGTYFPPEDRGNGMIPWPQLLLRISDYFRRKRGELEENASNILMNLEHMGRLSGDAETEWRPRVLLDGLKQVLDSFDSSGGGFGGAPKFPQTMLFDYCLSMRSSRSVAADAGLAGKLDLVIPFSLEAICRSGLYDQVGGGIFRYCVDSNWTIPHFEKMLYDNGQWLSIMARAYTRYPKEWFRLATEGTIDWLEREMRGSETDGGGPASGYASALDADSPGGEGRFYCWTTSELGQALAPLEKEVPGVTKRAAEVFGLKAEGNFEHGWNHLSMREAEAAVHPQFAEVRARLLRVREERGRPGLDGKRIAGWNALVVRGLADAAFAFGRKDWFEMGRNLAGWIEETFTEERGILRSVWYPEGETRLEVFLEDQAYMVEALLSLARSAPLVDVELGRFYVEKGRKLMDRILENFSDGEAGLYSIPFDAEPLLIRRRDWYDNAVPSGNSAFLCGLRDLYALSGDARYAAALAGLRLIYSEFALKVPSGVSHALAGLALEAVGVPVLKFKQKDDAPELMAVLARLPWRGVFPLFDAATPGRFQVCIGTTCLEPTDSLEQCAVLLGG